jgi:hypothetical protein
MSERSGPGQLQKPMLRREFKWIYIASHQADIVRPHSDPAAPMTGNATDARMTARGDFPVGSRQSVAVPILWTITLP